MLLALIGLTFGSLLTFPIHLPVMIGLWGIVGIVAIFRDRPAWPWLLSGAVILAIKRPGFTWEFWIVVVGYLGLAIADFLRRRRKAKSASGIWQFSMAVLIVMLVIQYGAVRWQAARTAEIRTMDDRPIVCLGDSLTDFGYPQELEILLTVPVVDFGYDGINTDAGIKLIPAIMKHRPQVVVIELGGHDYNSDRKTRAELRANLVTMIETFQQQQIAVILVEIPRGFVSDPYDGVERELAAIYDLELIDDSVIRSFIFNSPILPPGSWRDLSQHFSEDGLHPNRLGNKYFAKIVSKAIENVLGPNVSRRQQNTKE